MEREKKRYAQNSGLGHISRVKNYGKSSTTTLMEHLTTEHQLSVEPSEPVTSNSNKLIQSKLVTKKKLEQFEPCTTQYELNRDLAIWASLDLEPFMFTEKRGINYFFEKNFPTISLPSRNTLSRGALYDIYNAVESKVKEELGAVKGSAVCIMMDGWTDKYKRYPYLGLRVGYVDCEWRYKVVTISVKFVEKHTALEISSHVRQELAAHSLELNTVQVFTTHDGASNTVKASQYLRTSHFQHCVAHSLHLLLVTDGITKIPELVDLLQRCKTAIIKLETKCYIVEDERIKGKDRESMDSLVQKISAVHTLLQADDEISFDLSESSDSHSSEHAIGTRRERDTEDCDQEQETAASVHRHRSLK